MTLIEVKEAATLKWAAPALADLLLAAVKEAEAPAKTEMEVLIKEIESLKEAMQESETTIAE